jgi:YHS domain-containing protein
VFRSLVLSATAVVLNLFSVGAAYGLLVLVFQHGVGADPMGFQQVERVEALGPNLRVEGHAVESTCRVLSEQGCQVACDREPRRPAARDRRPRAEARGRAVPPDRLNDIDSVCRMSVEPTGAHLEWQGQTIWFCSDGCKGEFAENPTSFEPSA